jgi:hypothetical protein
MDSLKRWFETSNSQMVTHNLLTVVQVKQNKEITLRETTARSGRQRYFSYVCKTKCIINRYGCFKSKLICE